MTIHTYLDLSTGHVSHATMKWIEIAGLGFAADTEGWPPMTIATYEHGCFITVPDLERLDAGNMETLPRDLANVLIYAFAHGARLVRLDSDGDRIETLPYYDW